MPAVESRASKPAMPEIGILAVVVIVAVLALGNFLAILDTTIANVLVNHIAGGLASSPSSGTWVITGYAVAEAIMVPLTGWLAMRFGPARIFIIGLLGYAVFSLLCGMATSMGMLIAFRIMLGTFAGPVIPLSQALLVKVVPKRYANISLMVWVMGMIMAPIAGPVLGGIIGDTWGWRWAFYFKAPLAPILAFVAWKVLSPYEPPRLKLPVDYVGLALLIVWVGALQIMLGNGQDLDWFSSNLIVALLVVTVVGFIAFVIWEMTEKNPIVNLNVYKVRAFSVSMVVIGIAFGVVFGAIVLVPLWLQTSMSYTATWAGYNSAIAGIGSLIAAPVATALIPRVDRRLTVMIGLIICAVSCLMRIYFNDQMTFWMLGTPQVLLGFGQTLMMLTLTDMSTIALKPEEVTDGAVQFNFIRTLASAVATAAVVALWNHEMAVSKAQLAGALQIPQYLGHLIHLGGMAGRRALYGLDGMVQGQAIMQSTNITFLVFGILMIISAAIVWIAPKSPKRASPH
jgi:MFS transporter, DHA2 family, multidrug resistance protein